MKQNFEFFTKHAESLGALQYLSHVNINKTEIIIVKKFRILEFQITCVRCTINFVMLDNCPLFYRKFKQCGF